jgi:shikimate dehydrogenase
MVSAHLAVLGSPIEHSRSPIIHGAAYRELGLPWDYARYRVEANELADFLKLRDSSWRGLSLTMPLKEVGFELSLPSCPVASETGVVNTLLQTEEGWEGYNTDSFGIQQAVRLKSDLKFDVLNVLGSGATARSAVHALGQLFPGVEVLVYARKATAVQGVATKPLDVFYASEVHGLTISTLPGSVVHPRLNIASSAWILDVAYDPWPSKLAAQWPTNNRISGLEMLIWQAIVQIRLFKSGDGRIKLGDEATLAEIMRNAVKL